MKTIHFTKMHGAGNDFILLNNLDESMPSFPGTWIQQICRRHEGIGADGVIVLQKDNDFDFNMFFLNNDGRPASMCGNGARCAARYAHDHAGISAQMTFKTAAGSIHASVFPDGLVSVDLTPPHSIRRDLSIPEATTTADYIDTGVPHAVIFTGNINIPDFSLFGQTIRNSMVFNPEGTNVNLAEKISAGTLKVRTYERGVEAETLACGTGIAACALIAHLKYSMPSPIQAECAHGDRLTVSFQYTDGTFSKVRLQGPAEYCFCGETSFG